MGKVFITSENDNAYTAKVTSNGRLHINAGSPAKVWGNSAHTLISGTTAYGGACYVDAVILGDAPGTAAQLQLFDTALCASNISALGLGSTQNVAKLGLEVSGGGTSGAIMYPRTIPVGVYCASGLTYAVSHSACDGVGRVGCLKNFTIVYTAA